MKANKKALATALAGLCILALGGCGQTPRTVRGFAMDTVTAVTVYKEEDEAAAQAALSELDGYEAMWSATKTDSPVYEVNHGTGRTLDRDAMEMLALSSELEQRTGGAFTLAVRPLVELWHIDTRTSEQALPTEAQIDAARALCGGDKITTQPNTDGSGQVTAAPGAGLDLGSVAKGRAADALASFLQQQGVEDALIDLGGNVRAVGEKTYTVGLQDPRAQQFVFATIDVCGKSAVTSGDYQRYVEKDGQRLPHILDARTGRPAQSGLMSVTIVGENGMLCDALSTAVFILGEEKGLELVQAYDVEAVLVDKNRQVTVTQGLQDSFTLQRRDYTMK